MTKRKSSPQSVLINQTDNKWYNNCYELAIFLIFSLKFFTNCRSFMTDSPPVTSHYVFTYELGYGTRFLLGTIISLFTDYVTNKMFYTMATIVYFVLILAVSIFFGRAVRKAAPEIRTDIMIFALLFISTPYSITYLLGTHYGRIDTYWLILTIVGLAMMRNKYLKWGIPLLCIVLMLLHNGYMVTYMPALCIPLLYEVYKSKGSKSSIFIFSISCVILIGIFISSLVIKPTFLGIPVDDPVESAKLVKEYLQTKTDMPISQEQLFIEYFAPFPEWLTKGMIPLVLSYAGKMGPVLIIMTLPVFLGIGYVWKNAFKKSEDKFFKFIMFLCMVAPLMFLIAGTFGADWDRWWAAMVNTQFLVLFYFVYSKEQIILDGMKTVANFGRRHYLIMLFVMLFTFSLSSSEIMEMLFKMLDIEIYFKYWGQGINYHISK